MQSSKVLATASTLLRKMSTAIPQAVIHHRAFFAFTESLQVEHSALLIKWEAEVQAWELDRSVADPYALPDHRTLFLLSLW